MHVLIVEDHLLIRDMLAVACRTLFAEATIETACRGSEGLAACGRTEPDLVLLDLVLPDADGLELATNIFRLAPGCRLIALTSFTDEVTVYRALRAEVHGFIDKNEQPLHALREAIKTVMDGGRYLSPAAKRVQASLRSDPHSFDKLLSEREQKLLGLFGEGMSNEAVADAVGLSPATVKSHRRNILSRLGIHSTPELMHYALEKGFTRIRRANAG